jgi:transglycosylase-like protein with SLT domain
MANRQTRDPGAIRRFNMRAQVSGALPGTVVEGGQVFAAMERFGGRLSGRLKQMADKAAAREGALAGLNAGARAGAGYQLMRAGEQAAERRAYGFSPQVEKAIGAAAKKRGVDPAILRMIAGLESAGDPGARNPNSSATGLFQFTAKTAKEFGLTDPGDAGQSADAAARLLNRNAATLTRELGRAPTSAELYLAHQQGGAGAAKLLGNPDALAADLVGRDAVVLNGGRPDMSAGDFAAIWLGKAGGGAPAAKPDQIEPLELRRDNTISGQAFDVAATQAYGWRVQGAVTQEIGAAFAEFRADPAAYEAAIAEIGQKYEADPAFADPQLRELLAQTIDQATRSDRLQIAEGQKRRVTDELALATGSAIEGTLADISRQAFNLGANGEAADILAPLLARGRGQIETAVSQGLITPAAGKRRLDALVETSAAGQVQGTFEALETPAAKESFAIGLLEDWSAGKGPIAALSFPTVKALNQSLYRDARAEANRLTAENRAEAGRLSGLIDDDLASMAATGQGVDGGADGLDPERVGLVLGPEKQAEWLADRERASQVWQAGNGMELESRDEIEARLAALQPEAGAPGFARDQDILAETYKRAQTILTERVRDPLGQANGAGLVTLEPIDTTDGGTLSSSITLRREQARAVSSAYGTPLTIFQPNEAARLTRGLIENPDLLPGFATSVAEVFGDMAPLVLAEISEEGPELAQAAGLALATGDNGVAADIANVLSMRQKGEFKAKMPSSDKFSRAASAVLSGAFVANSNMRQTVTGVAALLFEQRANLMGFDPADIGKPDSVAAAAYERAVRRALGERQVGGEQYGGLVEVNGRMTIAPTGMKADRVPALLSGLSQGVMDQLPPIAAPNGVAVSADQVRRARLVAVGDGAYRVALGDPGGFDPQYLTGESGELWVLDLEQVQNLSDARPLLERLVMGPFGIGRPE